MAKCNPLDSGYVRPLAQMYREAGGQGAPAADLGSALTSFSLGTVSLGSGAGALRLGVEAALPSVLEELGPAGSVFGRTRLGGSSWVNINANDALRVGWGWIGDAKTGTNVFRISGDWVRQIGVKSGHIDLFTWP